MHPNITIRAVNGDQDEVVCKNWTKMWNEVGVEASNFVPDYHSKTLDFVAHARKQLDCQTFVAQTQDDGEVVGSVCCQVWRGPQPQSVFKIGTMWAVYVDPDYRRQGIATKMVERCVEHWRQVGCAEAVLIYASEEGKRVYRRLLGFRPGHMLAYDVGSERNNKDTIQNGATNQVVHVGTSQFSIADVRDSSHDLLLASNYRKLLLSSNVAQAHRLLQSNMVDETLKFIQDARLRLQFRAFVAYNDDGHVVASVCGQVWEGPLPCIVDEAVLKFGSIWGLYIHHQEVEDATELVSALVHTCVGYLKSIGCHKILTLCANQATQDLLTSSCSFHSSNALVLKLAQTGRPTKTAVQGSALVDGVTQEMVDELRNCHEYYTRAMTDMQLCWLLISNHNQLEALDLADDDVISATIHQIQKRHGLYTDPNDNWFTRNVTKLGNGFDLKKLLNHPQALSLKFDKLAPNYDAWTLGNHSKIESWIAEMARQRKVLSNTSTHVLDICCGTGLQGHMLRLYGFQGMLSGFDVSPEMLRQAGRRRCYDHLEVANVNQGIDHANGIADVIICTGAMELLDTKSALATFSRLVKPGGELWITFQAAQDTMSSATAHQHVQGIDDQTMRMELSQQGFEIVSVDFRSNAFYTPSPNHLDRTLLPVPYFYVCCRKPREPLQW